jgi:hypothetical protein
VVYIRDGVLFSHTENEIRLFGGKWMKLEIIMLKQIIQTQKDKYSIFPSCAESRLNVKGSLFFVKVRRKEEGKELLWESKYN